MIVGIGGGIYGIAGGSIIAPFFMAFFHLPVYTVAGAALMGTFVTSVAGVTVFQVLPPFYNEKRSHLLFYTTPLTFGRNSGNRVHMKKQG